MKEALKDEAVFSVIVFSLENYDGVEEKFGPTKAVQFVRVLEDLVRRSLRKRGDVVIRGRRAVLLVLPSTGKEGASIAAGRMEQEFDQYLEREGLQSPVRIRTLVATFPEDGSTEEGLLAKVETALS